MDAQLKGEQPKSLAETKDNSATNDAFLKEFGADTKKEEKPKLLSQADANKEIEKSQKEWELKFQAQKVINDKKIKDMQEDFKK